MRAKIDKFINLIDKYINDTITLRAMHGVTEEQLKRNIQISYDLKQALLALTDELYTQAVFGKKMKDEK